MIHTVYSVSEVIGQGAVRRIATKVFDDHAEAQIAFTQAVARTAALIDPEMSKYLDNALRRDAFEAFTVAVAWLSEWRRIRGRKDTPLAFPAMRSHILNDKEELEAYIDVDDEELDEDDLEDFLLEDPDQRDLDETDRPEAKPTRKMTYAEAREQLRQSKIRLNGAVGAFIPHAAALVGDLKSFPDALEELINAVNLTHQAALDLDKEG